MADKQISELMQVGALNHDGAFVVQQGGEAYKATTAQVAALSGGSSGENGTYYLDFTSAITVDPAGDAQGFAVIGFGDAALLTASRVVLKYYDMAFEGVVMEANRTNLMWGADIGESLTAVMFFAHTNAARGVPASFRVRLIQRDEGNFNAQITYWPDITGSAEVSAVPRMTVGQYVGTGLSGKDNPNTLTFDFTPMFVAIAMDDGAGFTPANFIIRGQSGSSGLCVNSSSADCLDLAVSWSGNTISWYATDPGEFPRRQFNQKGATYCYFAIGV